jgi:NAD kinase
MEVKMIMERLTENKIVMVKRRTRLEDLITRYNTIAQAKFYIEHMGSDFSDYISEDDQYKKAISEAHSQLVSLGRVQIVDREYVPNFIFGENDIVVVIGQDGLVANTLKYLSNQQLVGVNPDPARWDGVLLPFKVADLKLVIQDVFKKRRQIKEVSMAKAALNDGQTIYAVNDLFIGQRTHVSSRYHIQLGERHEYQSSSGIIVSTGLGSTGWLKSILAGATNIVNGISDKKIKVQQERSLVIKS